MDHEKTLELLAKALEIAPGDWETRSHMASLCIELGRGERAARLLEAAPALPDDVAGKLHAAGLLHQAGANNAALQIADGLIAASSTNAQAHLLKANIYRDRGLDAEARRHYNLAAVIDPSLEDEHFEAWLDGGGATTTRPATAGGTRDDPPRGGHDAGDGVAQPPLPSPFDDLEPDFNPPPPGVDAEPSDSQPDFTTEMAEEFDEMDDHSPFAVRPDFPLTTFSDVGGMEPIKESVRMKIVYPFKNKGVFARYGKRAGGGLLLYGPPGCGKTLVARAAAGESAAPLITVSIADVLSRWFGESEERVHALFEAARRHAPSILLVDELDALGVRRSDAGGSMAGLVNVLLGEIDRSAGDNDGVLVVGATNSPWRVDSAFRRPGRFDQTIFVPPPDADARRQILALATRGLPAAPLDLEKLVRPTAKFSGADLCAVVDRAVEMAIAEEMRSGREGELTTKLLAAAIKRSRPTTLEWMEEAANYASYANRSGVYDELAEYLGEGR